MTTLTTARLALCHMRSEDAIALLGVFGDPVVMRAFDRGPFTPDEMTAWVARNLEYQDRYGFGVTVW